MSLLTLLPTLTKKLQEFSDALDALAGDQLNKGKLAGVEASADELFEAGNSKLLALPGITDGSDVSIAAENLAGKVRMAARVVVKSLAKGVAEGDTDKVGRMIAKGRELVAEIGRLVGEAKSL
jgi:hypothetical protein